MTEYRFVTFEKDIYGLYHCVPEDEAEAFRRQVENERNLQLMGEVFGRVANLTVDEEVDLASLREITAITKNNTCVRPLSNDYPNSPIRH